MFIAITVYYILFVLFCKFILPVCGVLDQRIQRTVIRQHKHVDKHLNKLGNITVHEY